MWRRVLIQDALELAHKLVECVRDDVLAAGAAHLLQGDHVVISAPGASRAGTEEEGEVLRVCWGGGGKGGLTLRKVPTAWIKLGSQKTAAFPWCCKRRWNGGVAVTSDGHATLPSSDNSLAAWTGVWWRPSASTSGKELLSAGRKRDTARCWTINHNK